MGRGIELVVFSGWNNFPSGMTDWGDGYKGCVNVVQSGAPCQWGAWREKDGPF